MESDGIADISEVKTDSGLIKLEPFSIKLETDIEKVDFNMERNKENVDVIKREDVSIKKDLDVKNAKIVKKIKRAMCFEDCYNVFVDIKYVGPFFAWQITADLMELKMIKMRKSLEIETEISTPFMSATLGG